MDVDKTQCIRNVTFISMVFSNKQCRLHVGLIINKNNLIICDIVTQKGQMCVKVKKRFKQQYNPENNTKRGIYKKGGCRITEPFLFLDCKVEEEIRINLLTTVIFVYVNVSDYMESNLWDITKVTTMQLKYPWSAKYNSDSMTCT